jgi:starvation-inducible DNA-binding protein
LQSKAHVETVDTGLEQATRQRLADGVAALVADTYALLVKTHGYHWNVVGPLFYSLHKLTEEQYTDLFKGVDDLAERVRALGFPAPGSFGQMASMSVIEEAQGVPAAEDMVKDLIRDHEAIVRRMREIAVIADELEDTVTNDLLTERMGTHEMNVWMLKAITTG